MICRKIFIKQTKKKILKDGENGMIHIEKNNKMSNIYPNVGPIILNINRPKML